MNEDPNLADEDRGLYPKYRAIKINEDDFTADAMIPMKIGGFPAEEVTEPFFLLKFSDPFAAAALRAYARECSFKYPQLAEDITTKLREMRK